MAIQRTATTAAKFGKPLSRLDQSILPLPGFAKASPEAGAFLFGGLGFAMLYKSRGLLLGQLQQRAIPHQVGDPEVWQAGLPGSKKLARTAELQIQFGQLEAVLRAYHGRQSLFALGRKLAAG